jgi:hypothetical protein
LNLVSDISWNPKYNLFTLAGFGHTFPVMVYFYESTEEKLNEILYHTSTTAGTTVLHQSSGIIKEPRTGTLEIGGKENEHIGLVNVRMT